MTPRVMVVDDDASIVFMLKEMLEGDGYDVETASEARIALERLPIFRPNLLVLDYNMPGVSGQQILDLLRSSADMASLPVLFLTGDPPEKILPGGGNVLTRCLTKPVALDEFSNAVRRMLQRK